mmetsp:Transcript_122311/g.211500  ORF Transcript_122311/g.211500 Transcript_122311/m.211500 type:complete len:85 (+) Transcript_122311:121-375(+)
METLAALLRHAAVRFATMASSQEIRLMAAAVLALLVGGEGIATFKILVLAWSVQMVRPARKFKMVSLTLASAQQKRSEVGLPPH